MERLDTFGETLFRFMQSKNCSMKELTARMGIKSVTTVARIVADKSSANKIDLFCTDLLEKNPLGLVEAEKQELRKAASISAEGVDNYVANQQMLNFLQERPHEPSCVCRQAFGDDSLFIGTLDELLLSYRNYAQVDIMLRNCALSGVTSAFKTFLEQRGETKVNIEHYVSTSANRIKMISDFTNLLDVMGHPDYHFFFSPICNSTGNDTFHAFSRDLVALKCDYAGNKWTDIVHFYTEDSFEVLYNMPGEATYAFNMHQFIALRNLHNPAKSTHSNEFNFEGMLDYSNRLLQLDLQHHSLIIRPDICLCMVPPDIFESAVRVAIGSQLEQSQAALQQYMQVVSQRYQLFTNPDQPRKFLFSRAGMLCFYRHGKSQANVFGLRDLTPEERRRVIEGMLSVAQRVPTTTFHLLKNELHYNHISYCLYGDKVLLIDSYQGFSNFDPAKAYHSCCIRTPELVSSFARFATQDLLDRYVFSAEDTVAFLKELLQIPPA